MKILKLLLKNFAAVSNAMNASELEIDLSTMENKVCLIIGPNGSGKTTILSYLQPFADVGNLDIRNGNSLILKDKEGYKELVIEKEGTIYTIKHFYTPQKEKNHSVKSYLMKNDVELNVNGNVTSFKELIKEELQIEPDYLKLIRIGSNVTSLIGLTTTERKNFMSKLMDEIGVFLDHYKSVNTKLRQLDEMISHTIDKMTKLGITDKDTVSDEIEKEKGNLEKEEAIYIDLTNRKSICAETMANLEKEDNYSSKEYYARQRKFDKMKEIFEKKDTLESMESSFYEEKIRNAEKRLVEIDTNRKNYVLFIQSHLTQLNQLEEQEHLIVVQMEKDKNTGSEIKLREENLKKMRLKMREIEDIIGDFTSPYSKEEFEKFYLYLKNTQNLLNHVYEFGKKPIQKVVDLMAKKKNVIDYINKHLIDLDDKKNDQTALFLTTIMNRIKLGQDVVINCKEECAAKEIFFQLKTMLENSEVEEKSENADFYRDMELTYKSLKEIFPSFEPYANVITHLPEEVKKQFQLSSVREQIKSLSPIYDEKEMNHLYMMVSEYDNYMSLAAQYENEEKTKLQFVKMVQGNDMEEQLDIVKTQIEEGKSSIRNYRKEIQEMEEEEKDLERELERDKEIKETLEEYEEFEKAFLLYEKNYESYQSAENTMKELTARIIEEKAFTERMKKDLQQKISNYDQYIGLEKDLKKMNKAYDDMTFIKEALSSKEGMPLYFISNYLNHTEEITNELLDIAYDGTIFIDKFQITPTEFAIPFFNRGKRLEDVKYASQGELSFLSVALSFALSSQALSRYNIMLLDEVDGPLDKENREKFIRVLENQIDRINSEQSFLITHNDMFSSYPVDIIDLSFSEEKTEYPLAHYIDIKRK